MSSKFRGIRRIVFSFVAIFLGTTNAQALICTDVRDLVGVYFKMHFSQNQFDDELSQRTLDSLLRAWDPGKAYFLQSDIDKLNGEFGKELKKQIMSGQCTAISTIFNLYSKRFADRQKSIVKLIKDKHDFSVEEYLVTDRKQLQWAKTEEELIDRWRKRVKFQLLQLKKSLKGDLESARAKLTKRYSLAAKTQNELTGDDVFAIFLNAFSTSLDPHTEYMSVEQLEDFRIQTSLSLEGIGAVLRSEDGFTNVQSLVPGGAAAKGGLLKVDDKIIAVAQGTETPVDVIDMDLREVVKMIRGTGGTEVRLTVIRETEKGSENIVIPIVREKVELTDRAAKSRVYKLKIAEGKEETYKIGYLHLPSFYIDFQGRQAKNAEYTSSSRDMMHELEKLNKEGIQALVVDLRSNGGGSLDESIKAAGLFFDSGPVVQVRDMGNPPQVNEDTDGKTYFSGPMLVMINRQSASASEIFAGAIQDYGRGLIIGDLHTFGKGTVQNLNDVGARLGAIKVTISKFYRPSGSSTQLKGVESDIVLPSFSDQLDIGEEFYDYALPWDKTTTAKYKSFNYVQPYVQALKKASSTRIESDEGYKKLVADIKKFQSNVSERSRVSLKETPDDIKEAAEKGKSKGKSGGADEDADNGDAEIPLSEDLHLQETLRVAVD